MKNTCTYEWKNGDLNIAEQVVTIHKRWHFEHMGKALGE